MKVKLKDGFWSKNDPNELKKSFEKILQLLIFVCIGNIAYGVGRDLYAMMLINFIVGLLLALMLISKTKYDKKVNTFE